MDFIEGLPKSEGYSIILDRLTKYAHFLPVRHPYTAISIAKLFLDTIVKLHVMPQSIISDRDPIFVSSFWRELFKIYRVNLNLSTAYHPQTDGQTERVNQCLEMYLRCAVHDSPKIWKSWLPLAELWYNSSFHSSLGCSPFKALYGYDPDLGGSTSPTPEASLSVTQLIEDRALHLQNLRQRLQQAQNRMKVFADRNRTDQQFSVGDSVLLRLQPYTQSSVANRPFPKLSYKFFGPYTVLEKIGAVAYRLQLPDDSAIHPVFHISQLKAFHPDYTPVYKTLPTMTDLEATTAQPEKILEHRLVKKGNNVVPQVLITWTGLPQDLATWEDYHVVKERFPKAPAWGQAETAAGELSRHKSEDMEK